MSTPIWAVKAFPFFAAAAIIGHVARGPQAMVDALVMVFIAARVVYFGVYLMDIGWLGSLVGWWGRARWGGSSLRRRVAAWAAAAGQLAAQPTRNRCNDIYAQFRGQAPLSIASERTDNSESLLSAALVLA